MWRASGRTVAHGVVAVALLAGAACGDVRPPFTAADGGPPTLRVVTTTTVLTDFARRVGGERVGVHPLLGAHVDPHDYEATPADLEAIADADVIVQNGVGLEDWFDDTIDSAGAHALVVDASAGVARRVDDDGHPDPHIWHDPRNAEVMVANIARAFAAADPARAPTYELNRRRYTAEIAALDEGIAARLGALTDRKVVTDHDAFGYYLDRYGLQLVGTVIPTFDTQAELSPGDVSDLVEAIRSEGVRAVFAEGSVPARTAEAVAAEAGVRVVAGEGALYGDGLGPDGSAGDTYLKAMEHNTDVFATNLG
jgi:ABC-type Zn uptake system ZnuABC Zn-binding protein ZnuA